MSYRILLPNCPICSRVLESLVDDVLTFECGAKYFSKKLGEIYDLRETAAYCDNMRACRNKGIPDNPRISQALEKREENAR